MENCKLSDTLELRIYNKLVFLYGKERAEKYLEKFVYLIHEYKKRLPDNVKNIKSWFDQQDIVLITYGDQFISSDGNSTLHNLNAFLTENYKNIINSVHILPFYPYSSDDGFSVIDYWQVNKELGSWADIISLSKGFNIMFDAVVNHISSESSWFQEYLKGNPEYSNFFIEVNESQDLSSVTRPRALPLLTRFRQLETDKFIWTTFSDDQIDINYANPEVLLKVTELILFYVSMGASMLRLDAIGYLWKRFHTTCINLEETHTIVRFLRDITDAVNPGIKIVTETNIPHKENISYFGNGFDEAHMVYQFALPPLVMHSFFRGTASYLIDWADQLEFPSDNTTYFNFLASHDGIGVMPVKGILPDEEIQELCKLAVNRGGHVSYKNNTDGSASPYELNIVYFNAIANPKDNADRQIDMFLCAHAIMLSMKGVPGIYIHSLLGSQNYSKGVENSGRNRSINREKFQISQLEEELNRADSHRSRIVQKMKDILAVRAEHKAFHPNGEQKIIKINSKVFSMLRCAPDLTEAILCLHNVSGEKQCIEIKLEDSMSGNYTDILSGQNIEAEDNTLKIVLGEYQAAWYRKNN